MRTKYKLDKQLLLLHFFRCLRWWGKWVKYISSLFYKGMKHTINVKIPVSMASDIISISNQKP